MLYAMAPCDPVGVVPPSQAITSSHVVCPPGHFCRIHTKSQTGMHQFSRAGALCTLCGPCKPTFPVTPLTPHSLGPFHLVPCPIISVLSCWPAAVFVVCAARGCAER
jgi:hypothetical protein